jgi:hypothetical protein
MVDESDGHHPFIPCYLNTPTPTRSAPSAGEYPLHHAIIEGFLDYLLARICVSDPDDPTRYPGVPMPYPCFIHASRMLHACFTHASRMPYGCLTDASRLEYRY